MSEKRFILNSSRSSKQGTLINVGKYSEEYKELTETMTMEAGDMEAIGLAEGQRALVKTEFGESEFTCQAGKVPPGMIFIPYGPPTCLLMGGGHRWYRNAHFQGVGSGGGSPVEWGL